MRVVLMILLGGLLKKVPPYPLKTFWKNFWLNLLLQLLIRTERFAIW